VHAEPLQQLGLTPGGGEHRRVAAPGGHLGRGRGGRDHPAGEPRGRGPPPGGPGHLLVAPGAPPPHPPRHPPPPPTPPCTLAPPPPGRYALQPAPTLHDGPSPS